MPNSHINFRWLCLLLLSGLPMLVSAQDIGALLPGGAGEVAAAEADNAIALGEAAPDDGAIAARLRQIYSEIDALSGIEVEARAGVVELRGSVLSSAAEEEAVRLARQVQGVVSVEDRLERSLSVGVRVSYALDLLRDRFYALLFSLPLLLVALLVFVGFWYLGSVVIRWDRPFERMTHSPFVADLLKQLVRIGIVIIGGLICLQLMDATALISSLLGAMGLIGLAVGFAIRDTVENYIASILLSLRQPFAPNDHVVIQQYEGKVVRLTSRATVLMTFDGNHVRIPNAVVYKEVITNYSRNPERRFQFEVGVAAGVDLAAARALAITVVGDTPGVLASPPPSCQVKSIGDSSIPLQIFAWTDQRQFDVFKVRSVCIQALLEAFDGAGIEMPEPIYRLRMESVDEAAQVVGGPRASGDGAHTPGPVVLDSSAQSHVDEVSDVSREDTLDARIREEAATEGDLLNESAPRE